MGNGGGAEQEQEGGSRGRAAARAAVVQGSPLASSLALIAACATPSLPETVAAHISNNIASRAGLSICAALGRGEDDGMKALSETSYAWASPDKHH